MYAPGERNSVRRLICVRDGECEENMSVGFILLDIYGIVSFREHRRIIISVLHLDVHEDGGREDRVSVIPGLDLQN